MCEEDIERAEKIEVDGKKVWDVLKEYGLVYFCEDELEWRVGFHGDVELNDLFFALKDKYMIDYWEHERCKKIAEKIAEEKESEKDYFKRS